MNKYTTQAAIGVVGCLAIGVACYITSSSLPLLGMLGIAMMLDQIK